MPFNRHVPTVHITAVCTLNERDSRWPEVTQRKRKTHDKPSNTHMHHECCCLTFPATSHLLHSTCGIRERPRAQMQAEVGHTAGLSCCLIKGKLLSPRRGRRPQVPYVHVLLLTKDRRLRMMWMPPLHASLEFELVLLLKFGTW